MEQKYYTIVFKDETSDSRLSSGNIATGINSKIGTGTSNAKKTKAEETIGQGIAEELKSSVGGQVVGSIAGSLSSKLGVNLMPAVGLGKSIITGAGAAAVGGGIAAVALTIAEAALNAWLNYKAEQEQKAIDANNQDNILILAGKLNITGATITKGSWGRDQYKYDRS